MATLGSIAITRVEIEFTVAVATAGNRDHLVKMIFFDVHSPLRWTGLVYSISQFAPTKRQDNLLEV